MNWLKKHVIKWVREDRDKAREGTSQALVASREVEARMCEADPILNFRVFSAVGGQVVEFRRYDRKTDRSDITTYIVGKDDDFGEAIAKISTVEMLKQ